MTSRKNQQKQQSTHIHHFFVSGKLHTQANTHTYTTHLIWNEKSYTTSQFASIFHFLIFGVFNEIFHWPICSLCASFYKTYKKRENEQKKMTTRTNLSPFFYLYSHGIEHTHGMYFWSIEKKITHKIIAFSIEFRFFVTKFYFWCFEQLTKLLTLFEKLMRKCFLGTWVVSENLEAITMLATKSPIFFDRIQENMCSIWTSHFDYMMSNLWKRKTIMR